jgi:hypothetical protein
MVEGSVVVSVIKGSVHVGPDQGSRHSHLNVSVLPKHVPPFWHGSDKQALPPFKIHRKKTTISLTIKFSYKK